MKKRFMRIIVFLSFLILMNFLGVSCGTNRSQSSEKEEGIVSVDSFKYEMNKNESSIPNELSYSLSFEINFSMKLKKDNGLTVRIYGKKSNFTIDYSNTENVTISKDSYSDPYAMLYYTLPTETMILQSNVKLKIRTNDLIEDINEFLKISLFVENGSLVDPNDFMEDGNFKMSYSDSIGVIHYEFNEFTESYKLVSVITKSKSFEVPAMYQNYPVKEIAEDAFRASTEIENLILPKTLISLPKGLLNNMTNLKSLTIPFLGASPDDTEHNYLGYLFGAKHYTENTEYILGDMREVILTSGNIIGEGAFYHCGLNNIEIPNGITRIGDHAFEGCNRVTNIVIPASVVSIGDCSFKKCLNLTSVVLGEGLTSIGEEAFSNCSSLINVTMGQHVDRIGAYAFSNCKNLTSITIPEGVTRIEDGTFYLCQKITSIAIPDSVTSISNNAFWQCSSLKSVILGNCVESIGFNVFELCYNLEYMIVNDTLASIGSMVFHNCMNLKEIYYMGTSNDWKAIHINESNDLSSIRIYYYLETEPTEEGYYWHYVDGKATKW